MPRGNDTEHAASFNAGLMEQYGIHSNAADMIAAHRASIDPALTRASMIGLDADATEEAKGDLDEVGRKLGLSKGVIVLDAAVRGNAVIAVVQNEHGVVRKVVGGWTDKYDPPELTAEQASVQAQYAHDQQVREETARLRARADERIAEVRREEDARITAEITKIREDADAELSRAVEEASGGESQPQAKPSRRGKAHQHEEPEAEVEGESAPSADA